MQITKAAAAARDEIYLPTNFVLMWWQRNRVNKDRNHPMKIPLLINPTAASVGATTDT